MKFAFVLLGLAFCGFTTANEYYSSTYDNMDVDAILSSERLLKQYMDCIFEQGPCTADGRNLRRVLPDAMATSCEKCTPKQKRIARKIIGHLKENKPDDWVKFTGKFDPNGMYFESFEEFLAQEEEEEEEEEEEI